VAEQKLASASSSESL